MAEVYQIVPNDELLQKLTTSRWLDAEQVDAVNRFRIISCVFERDRVSDYTVKALNRVGMVWVANEKDKAMLKGQGVERVAVVPIPHFPDDPLLKMQGRERRPGPVRFYHIGKWEPRKAHHEMLGAFLMAFKPGDAKFYFKTSTKAPDYADYPSSPDRSVHAWVKDERVVANGWTIESANRDIHLIRQRVPPEQIRLLHSMGDVYLSLSRGEGFDMPAYDAKLAGNMLVYTPSGGPQDYATDSDLVVSPCGDVPCHPFYRWGDARYLDWDYPAAVAVMQRARVRVLSGRWRHTPLKPIFSAAGVGHRMRNRIDEVIERGRKLSEA
jgi:glycosyltransferase involved in cell wall biosynthesis